MRKILTVLVVLMLVSCQAPNTALLLENQKLQSQITYNALDTLIYMIDNTKNMSSEKKQAQAITVELNRARYKQLVNVQELYIKSW